MTHLIRYFGNISSYVLASIGSETVCVWYILRQPGFQLVFSHLKMLYLARGLSSPTAGGCRSSFPGEYSSHVGEIQHSGECRKAKFIINLKRFRTDKSQMNWSQRQAVIQREGNLSKLIKSINLKHINQYNLHDCFLELPLLCVFQLPIDIYGHLQSSPHLNLISFHGAGSRLEPTSFLSCSDMTFGVSPLSPHTVIPWLSPLMWLQENPQNMSCVEVESARLKKPHGFFQNLFWKTHVVFKLWITTLHGINISYLGKRKIIFKMPFLGDMLVPWRVLFWMFPDCSTSHFGISSASLLRVGAIDLTMRLIRLIAAGSL